MNGLPDNSLDASGTGACLGCRDQKQVFLQVDDNISQVTIDHGFQLWDRWSRSPNCDIVSVAYPLDRRSWHWHVSYVVVKQ